MRDICEILGVNRSSFYYQPKADPSEAVLRAEIEKLAGAYPRYGYRRITQLLVRQGYSVGTRRVARLMKAQNLLVSIKRAIQTTKSLQETGPWSNRNPKTLRSLIRIRSGWLILPMFASRNVSSISRSSWMSSRA